ncbi:MAG: hybrid sensor histidine kinase/response regulator [Gammaproteobacteria bacterium]|nr:hybrid sensor histidine kinase/response regulator [Gammaproteobacteria bacterium]
MRYKFKRIINDMSVGQKVLVVLFLEIFSYSLVTTIAISQISSVGNVVKQMSDLYLPLFTSSETVRLQIQEGRLNLKDIIFVGDRVVYDKEAKEQYIAARGKYQENNSNIDAEIDSSFSLITKATNNKNLKANLISDYRQDLLRQLSSVRQANRINSIRAGKVFRHVEDGSFLMGMEMISDVRASENTLTKELDALVTVLDSLNDASVKYAVRVENTATAFTILASIITFCIVITIFYYVVKKNISNPLHSLSDTINSVSALHDIEDSPIEKQLMSRGDELGIVSRSFNNLKHDLSAQDKDLRQAKEDAERANRAKSQFLAAASHDLRQPLHAMQMYITALQQKIKDKEMLKIVSDIDAVSVSTGRLLNSILDVSQLEAGAVKPQIEDFAIQEILNRIARNFRPMSYRKGLSLHIVPSSAYVRSDPILLEQIIGNFVANAIRYTETGRVLLGCRRRESTLSIEVLDTGPGIPKHQSEAIFDDFHQLDNKERDRGKGLGLGLAIVRRLSSCLNHTIEHSSELKHGSRFAVVTTLTKKPKTVSTEEKIDGGLFNLKNISILLIEDDPTVLDATQNLLTSWHCDVNCANSFFEARQVISDKTRLPDIILADYSLPGEKNGVETIESLRKIVGYPIPAFIITGEADTGKIRKITDYGFRVLSKPVHPAKLRALISHLLVISEKNKKLA